jgi:ABC-type Fe3+ transport system substrate-binding protein
VAQAPSRGKQLLDDLVKKAQAEGELRLGLNNTWSPEVRERLGEVFKQRFGLTGDVAITPILGTQHLPVAVTETRAGTPPSLDSVYGDDAETMQLVTVGGVLRVENWEALLAEINPLVGSGKVTPDQVSKGPLAGRGFLFVGNVKRILYNPRLIGEAELPRTHAELADPRFKDKFIQPPWTAHWEIAPAVLDNLNREQWLETVRAAGRNSGMVLPYIPATERLLLGQFAFALGDDTTPRRVFAKDPQAPLAAKFLDDYNPYIGLYTTVRTGTAHPTGATLWALWLTTPEAQAIWQPVELWAQRYGDTEIDQEQARFIREPANKVVWFLDNPRTIELLESYQTPEGRQYLDAIGKAIRGE